MVKGTETSIEERELIVKLALTGKSLREIAQIVGRSHSTIQGIVNKFIHYGIISNKQRTGRKPILSEEEKRDIVLEIIKNPLRSIPKLTNEIRSRIGRPVSCETIRRIYRTVGYNGITEVGDSPAPEEEMNEENAPAVDDEQMEGGGEFSNKKVRRRKKQLYQNIRKQMEFYFSDANLTKDRFLGKLMMEDPNIDVSVFLRFNKIRALTTDARDIANALRGSDLLSVTEDGTKVFRTTPVKQKENTDDCTIYVEQLPLDAQHDWLKEVFSAYGNVSYVSIPKHKTSGKIKGFAFIEFETPEEANKTLEAFGAMGCRLSTQMAPEKLCSIQTFEPDGEKSELIPDDEINRELTDEDPDNPSKKKMKKKVTLELSEETNIEECETEEEIKDSNAENPEFIPDDEIKKEPTDEDPDSSSKKKKKKKVNLGLSEETNIEESETEDYSENTHQTKLKKRKKSDGEEIKDSNAEQEAVNDDSPPKKKKRKKNDSTEIVEKEDVKAEEDISTLQESDVSEDQSEKKKKKRKNEETEEKPNDDELENVEIDVSKKKRKKSQERTEEVEESKESVSDEIDKHFEKKKHKRKSEETEEIEEAAREIVQPEGGENEGEEVEEEEMMEEGVEELGKKRRKRKKHKKKKPDVEAGRLKILSKKEWKRLRNKYLDLQKMKMKCLKQYMGRNRWNRGTPRPHQSNGNVQEKEETNTESTKQPETEKKPRIAFTPGVIVHAMFEEPVMDIRKFKAEVKTFSEVEYVDIVKGGNDAFIRCSSSTAAENLISNAPWQQTEILKGDVEKNYWDRIFQNREEKLNLKVRVKQRGRDKVLRKVERELGKHIRFDD